MNKVQVDNLEIPPLAGLCTYEEAKVPGFSVESNVELLRRYNYIETQLNQIMAAHLPGVPEWEVKCALSLHLWLDAEHSLSLRARVAEMREPPLYLDQVPDPKLQSLLAEVASAENTLELLVGIYSVVKRELIRSMEKHLTQTNRLVDQPTWRILRIHLREEEEMVEWGEKAIQGLMRTAEDMQRAREWKDHLTSFLLHARGFFEDLEPPEHLSEARWNGEALDIDPTPRRDDRFVDPFNQTALIDEYYRDENREFDERVLALMYKRLREMDVPEWMARIIYRTKGKPWEYYADLSRQLWDEARHAMMGEVGLYSYGIPFYKFPIDMKASLTLNTQYSELEAHTILWHIEQGLMPRKTGKQFEWAIAKSDGDELAVYFQDYDWADEVLHAQIGRRWLVSEYSSYDEMRKAGEVLFERWLADFKRLKERSKQEPWWPKLVEEVRSSRRSCSAQ